MDAVTYGSNLGTANTNREPSQTIWGRVPIDQLVNGRANGFYALDEFVEFPYITTPTITTEAAIGGKLGYKAFGSSGGTLLSGGSQFGDVALVEATDNEGVGLATIALPVQIDRNNANFATEIRLKCSTIADTTAGVFFGLMGSQTLSATVPIAAAGTLADNNFVGFHRLEGDGDQFDAVYKANGVTQVTQLADAITSLNSPSGSSALVANTYIKLGMFFHAASSVFTWYVNGIPCPTPKTVPSSTTAAGTDFPNDVTMGFCLAQLLAASSAFTTTVDWWGWAHWTDNP